MASNRGNWSFSSILQGSESAFDFHCDLCFNDNKYVEAAGYCVDCEDYLCQECFMYHLKPKPSQHHSLLDQHRMPKGTPQQKRRDTCTEQCAEHDDNMLEYYCAEDNTFACDVCVTLHHRNCAEVDYIPDIAKNVQKSGEYQDTIKIMKNLIENTQTSINASPNKIQTTNKQYSDTSDFFKKLRKDLSSLVDRLETLKMKDAKSIRDENLKRIKSVESSYEQLLMEIGALLSTFTSLENKGQHCNIFVSMKRSQNEIASLKTRLEQLQDQSYITEYVIKRSNGLQNLLKQPNNMISQEITNQTSILRDTEEHKKTTAVHVADIGVKLADDRKTRISGSVVLPNDKLVIVDNSNTTIKLIDLKSNKVASHLRHTMAIWDITAVTDTIVAVTSPNDKNILFINVTELNWFWKKTCSLKLDHMMKVKGCCRGIACMANNLVITYTDPVKVEIMSRRGVLLQTVIEEKMGRQLFNYPGYVAVSPDQQTIYISDWKKNTVTSLDLNGQVVGAYDDHELRGPYGLAVNRKGVLYVCGFSSNNVHQLTPDLHKIQILLQASDGIVFPQSVSSNEEQNKLFIGRSAREVVKVVQLLDPFS